MRGWDRLSRRRLGALCELIAWREEAARAQDVPPRTLLKDGVMFAVTRIMPESIGQLAAVKGFPRPLAKRRGTSLLEALQRAAKMPDAELPQAAARETDRRLVTWAMNVGREICESAGIDHAVFGTRRNYIDLVETLRTGRGDPNACRLLTGWRRDFAGKELRDAIARKFGT